MCQEEESHLCWRKVCGKHTKCILGGFIADIERWKYSPRGEMCFKHRVYKLYILPTKLVNSHFFWHLFHTVNIWEGSMGSALWQLSLFPHFLLTFATTRGVLAHTRTSSTQLESGLSGMMWHWFPAPCPSDPSDVGALIKVSLRACFYEEDLLSISAFEWDISRVKSWSRRACVRVRACVRDSSGGGGGGDRVAKKERRTALLRVAAFLRSGEGGSWVPKQSFLSSQASGSPTCMFGQGVNNRSGIRLV